eukprot:13579-Eustigmatos_ZCMA.PRE.1
MMPTRALSRAGSTTCKARRRTQPWATGWVPYACYVRWHIWPVGKDDTIAYVVMSCMIQFRTLDRNTVCGQ